MSRNGMSDDQGFCTLLERLATDPAGWQGQAGADFVELMSDLLHDQLGSRRRLGTQRGHG